MRCFVDADILIWHLRGERQATNFLQKLHDKHPRELWMSAMQRAEIVFFMRANEENQTQLLLAQFQTQAVDQTCVDLAGKLYRQWHPSHGTDVNDAILAATVIQTGGYLYTLNTKHFPMPEIVVNKAW